MFRKTTTQSSLFEVNHIFPDILPKDDWSNIYKDRIYPLINEDNFKHLFAEEGGAPNKSIKTMVSLLIFMGMEKLTWRGAEFMFPRRLDWLTATHTPIGEAQIDHTTLFKFYQRLEQDDTAMKLFQELTCKFAELCATSLKKQRTDSFFIHGWLQILSRYGLFKETIRLFLSNLRKQKPGLYEDIAPELSQNYLEKTFDLTEKDREKAQRKIALMAKDLFLLTTTFETHHQVKHYQSFKTLTTVFHQQCQVIENKDAETGKEIVLRDKPEGDEIVSTPHNTDARYTRKRDQKVCGQKGFLTETCDEDNQTQFITDVEVRSATTADSTELSNIQDRLDVGQMKPEEQYGDAGFVNGTTIIVSEKKGIALEGPSSGHSQSFEKFNDPDRLLDVADFEVVLGEENGELRVLSCPNDQTPTDQARSSRSENILVHFDPAVCSGCPLKDRCPTKIGVRTATLNIDEAAYRGAERHQRYMKDQDYRKQCATRAGAEGMVSEITRGHGARKSRHRSESRTRLQLIFAVLACNVKRFIRHGVNHGYLEPAAA
jgi:transposase